MQLVDFSQKAIKKQKGGIPQLMLEKINNEKLLITLTKEDVKILNLTFEKLVLKCANNKLKQIIKKIMFKQNHLTNFIYDFNTEFNIEFFLKNNEYSVFITRAESSIKSNHKKVFLVKKEAIPYVFKFKSLDDFIDLSKKVHKKFFLPRNSLVKYKNNYYIIIYFKETIVPEIKKTTLTEYAKFIGKGWAVAAKILEFGREIIPNNALLTFGEFL